MVDGNKKRILKVTTRSCIKKFSYLHQVVARQKNPEADDGPRKCHRNIQEVSIVRLFQVHNLVKGSDIELEILWRHLRDE